MNIAVVPANFPPLREEENAGKTRYFGPFPDCKRCKKGYKSKGAAVRHMKCHALRAEDLQAAARNGSQPQQGQAPPDKPPAHIPAESWHQLAGVDIGAETAPRGQAVYAFIPLDAKPVVSAALIQCSGTACAAGPAGEYGAAALALLPSLALGTTYVDNVQPVEQGVFNKEASRKRVAHIRKHTDMVLRGDWHGAREAAAARAAPSAQARRAAFDRARLFRDSQRSAGAQPGDPLVSQKKKRKIHNLIKVGELSRALAVFLSSEPARLDEATCNRLKELLPDVEEELEEHGKDLPAAVECDEDTLIKVIRKLKRLVAAGPSLLSNDHIKELFKTETDADLLALQPLLKFVNKALKAQLCRGGLPHRVLARGLVQARRRGRPENGE